LLRYEAIYKMVLENRLSKALLRAIPGLDDYSLLGKLWWHTTEEEPRAAALDTSSSSTRRPSGHAGDALRIPHGDPSRRFPEGRSRANAMKVPGAARGPGAHTGAQIMVTLAEEMPTNESIEWRSGSSARATSGARGGGEPALPDRFPGGDRDRRGCWRACSTPAARRIR
jgi:hypothetical protein